MRVESCEELVSRMARYPIELGVVRRMLGEMIRYLIEVESCKELFGGFEVFDRVGSCKENVRRNEFVRRRMLGEMRGI